MLIPSYLKNTAKEVSINDFLNVEIVTTSNEETFNYWRSIRNPIKNYSEKHFIWERNFAL
ncbi:hypothetical protein VFC2021_06010 [Listeria innocua]